MQTSVIFFNGAYETSVSHSEIIPVFKPRRMNAKDKYKLSCLDKTMLMLALQFVIQSEGLSNRKSRRFSSSALYSLFKFDTM